MSFMDAARMKTGDLAMSAVSCYIEGQLKLCRRMSCSITAHIRVDVVHRLGKVKCNEKLSAVSENNAFALHLIAIKD